MKGKSVLVTGASRGIGRAIALAFGRNGATVVVNFLKEKDKAQETVTHVQENGGKAFAFQADAANHDDAKRLVETVVRTEGRIDVLVNNAGIVRDRTIVNMSEEEWDAVIRTNVTGAFYMLQECGRAMAAQNDGAIINIASLVGLRGSFGMANYASAKGALLSLTKSAARELGPYNIRVNAVFPGFQRTDMGDAAPANYIENIKNESVLGVTTDLRELAEFIVFLARTKTVSGQVFNWDSRII